ncbi:hypothetical protein LTR99_002728 [Exophiala xenobiotica]|uniref:Amino acid permease n=1 Tax=Vermiconidia calcicola TaxID=1690605 RepID=A0AAV9QBC4_9PEZI|nr:hypothetical protein LTR40_005427 [Exophiala xenobiotica]KAK5538397.1 hypothetical protein LTR25_003939 [Vermiconidia calcicola]KAK5305186.1 hypothetical protein LTR99_002728 [Exophiala xenobiotica]KAK5333401.1 hypothetical protein LTR98_010376 [Exophiala xenobiotica]KAK5360524.1 hypothetical protein LTS13_010087 [Exophiala xenobiotica]
MTSTSTPTPPAAGEGHLEQRFSRLTMIGLTFGILNTWICLAGSLGIVMPSGSSVAFFYGFIFCVVCNFCLSASVGELSSIWPTAGGQYHYAFALSTEHWKLAMSFWVGWINIAGWLTLITTEAFFAAQFISAAAVVGSNGAYVITPWKTYCIFLAVSAFAVALNIFGYRILNRWNEFALFWSITACIVVSITILATGNKTSGNFVFTNFTNTTGWSDGMAWMLGLLQSALSLIGFDAVAHMTEEMKIPQRDAPQAMVAAVGIGGTTGIVFILVMLFSIVDVDTILHTSTGAPVTEMILQATGSPAAAVVLSCALAVCFLNGTNGCVTSGSRLLWAMARDDGSPFSRFLAHIHPSLNVPVRAILVAAVFNILFGLLYLGPTVAFNAYCASCTIFLNLSYAIPVTLLLIQGRGLVKERRPIFYLGHIKGYIMNVIGVCFVYVTSIFFCFPGALPVDASTMSTPRDSLVQSKLWVFFYCLLPDCG